jgi:hypothetical protein
MHYDHPYTAGVAGLEVIAGYTDLLDLHRLFLLL